MKIPAFCVFVALMKHFVRSHRKGSYEPNNDYEATKNYSQHFAERHAGGQVHE